MSKNLIGMMDKLAKGSPDWIQLGFFILEVGETKAWREIAPTFKFWLETFANKLNVSRASLFKYRAGVAVGMRLNSLHLSDSEERIRETLGKTKSDIIETLAKVIPLVPSELATKLTTEVFEGVMTRSRIRELLRLYKAGPADGEEARSYGSHHAILDAMTKAGTDWLDGSMEVRGHRLVPHVEFIALDGKKVAFDAVLIVRKADPNLQAEIHGLLFDRTGEQHDIRVLQEHCDYLWTTSAEEEQEPRRQVDDIGQLALKGGAIVQRCNARRLGSRASIAVTAHALVGALL